jgi:hypothetical protein
MGRRKGSVNKPKEVQMSEENTVVAVMDPPVDLSAEIENAESELDRVRLELEQTKLRLEEKKMEMKSLSSREHDKKEMEIVDKQVANFSIKAEQKARMEQQRIDDSRMVTGKFLNRRSPGQTVKLTYHKWETDPVKWYVMKDGGVYTISRGFADQLNGGDDKNPCYYTPKFTQKEGPMDPNQPESQIHSVDTSNHKYAFVPVGFS